MEQILLLFAAMFAPVNLGYTILLLVVLIIWIMVIVGALGLDSLDIDMDSDVDMDMDVDVDGDVDVDAGSVGAPSSFYGFLNFFNFGEVPLTVFISIFIVSMWAIGLTAYIIFNHQSFLLAVPIFVGNVIISSFVTKFFTAPIKKLFHSFDKSSDAESVDTVLGQTCTITTGEATETFGQAQIETDGAPIKISIVTYKGEKIKKGEEAVVIDYNKEQRVYIVKAKWD